MARVVIDARGEEPLGDDIPDLVNAVHRALEFQPGEELAGDAEARKVAGSLKNLVLGLSELRNRHGTGHGRGAPAVVNAEYAELAQTAAVGWSRWALRRVEPYIAGAVSPLVRELDDGEVFHKGELRMRLVASNLPRIAPDDQRRIGTAVGRRSARGTWNVATEGVDEIRPGEAPWPWPYVESIVNGLLFDANGFLRFGEWTTWTMRSVIRLAAQHPERNHFLRELATRVARAVSDGRVAGDVTVRQEAAGVVRGRAAEAEDAGEELLWREIADALARP